MIWVGATVITGILVITSIHIDQRHQLIIEHQRELKELIEREIGKL